MTTESILAQVREARAIYNQAHVAAETAAARYADLKTKVGSNEADRKTAKANTPEDVYAGYLTDYAAAELDKIAASAASERAQKNYDGLREELQRETADVNRAWAEIADRTAQTYATLQMQPPARVLLPARHDPNDPEF